MMYYLLEENHSSMSCKAKILGLTRETLHVLLFPRSRRNAELQYITDTSCFLAVRQDLNQMTAVTQIPQKCNLANKISYNFTI